MIWLLIMWVTNTDVDGYAHGQNTQIERFENKEGCFEKINKWTAEHKNDYGVCVQVYKPPMNEEK